MHFIGAERLLCINLVRLMPQKTKHFSFNLFTIDYFQTVICSRAIFITEQKATVETWRVLAKAITTAKELDHANA